MASPIMIGGKSVSFYDPQEEERKRRIAFGKAQGLDDATIAKYELIATTQQKLKQQAQKQIAQPQQPKAEPKKEGAFRANSFLGFGTSLLPFGEILRKKLNNEKISGGDVALEGVLSALPFAGKLIGKGAKAAKGAITAGKTTKAVAKTADVANDVNKEKNLLKALITPSKAGAEGTTLTQKAGQALSKNSTIAPTSTIGSANQQRKLVKFSQEEGLLRGSSARKFKNVEQVIGKRTDEVDSLLAGVKKTVPAGDLQKSLSSVRATIPDPGEAADFDKILGRIQKEIGDKPKYTALEINKARRVLNKELGSVNRKLEKGNPLTRGDRALQDAHEAFTDTLNKLAPKEVSNKVKEVNQRISTFIKGQPEFKKKSESADLLGARGQLIPRVPILKPTLESATDIAGRTLSKVGKAGSTPLGRQAQVRAPSSVASALGAGQPTPDQSQEQLPSDVSQVFSSPQSTDEEALNQIVAAGITDPQEMFDALSGTGKFAQEQVMGGENPLGISSQDALRQAYALRQAGDTKGFKDILEFAKVAAEFEKTASESGGGAGEGLNVTKPTSEKYAQAVGGANALAQLRQIIDKNGGVPQGTRVPGQGINFLGIGSDIKNKVGSGEYDAVGFAAVDNMLRIATGAAAPDSEIRRYMDKYLPKPGDSDVTIKRKLDLMEAQFNSLLSLAQPGVANKGFDINSLFNQPKGV